MEDDPIYAVHVIGLQKSYKRTQVLANVTLKVEQGTIYGLLGPSGCGKTTLLKCILGQTKINGGEVYTLGQKPGSNGHTIPGVDIGYMPQELALYQEFSIAETVYYFGRLCRLSSSSIQERFEFLRQLLNLPEQSRKIDTLSGGQQRRISFAIALLHEAPLLVLDEPTVGVDPILRKRIWEHLLAICQSGNTTIIITTHYIEEARQANKVGLLRNSRLLAEDTPENLMRLYQSESLEEVFLLVCEQDVGHKARVASHSENSPDIVTKHHRQADERTPLLGSSSSVVQAAYTTSTQLEERSCEPYNLSVGVVNKDAGFLDLAQKYLYFVNSKVIVQVPYPDEKSALDATLQGNTWGYLVAGRNFSSALTNRYTNKPTDVSNATIQQSTILVHLDMSNQQIAVTLQTRFMTAFETFAQSMLHAVHVNPAAASLPIQIGKPVYGSLTPRFTDFMAPGVIISITFFMATGLTALAFVVERKQGLLQRSMVLGVNSLEVMAAHVATQLLVMVVQVLLLLMFALAIFKVPCNGPIILVLLLTLFQGFIGMALGLVISALCDEETSAIQFALGSVYPNMLLSGIIWPIEAMPLWLRYVSISLPMTYGAQAVRCIMARGWNLTYMPVWRGFLVTIGWGWGLMALAAIILKIRR